MVTKAEISVRALMQRINRKLAAEDECLRIARKGTWLEHNLGRFYVLNYYENEVMGSAPMMRTPSDLEGFGRKLGAIAEWETVEGGVA